MSVRNADAPSLRTADCLIVLGVLLVVFVPTAVVWALGQVSMP